MKLKGIHAGRPAFFQLALLLGFSLAGILLASVVSLLVDPTGGNTQDLGILRFIQVVSTICMFLAPAVLVALLCSKEPAEYLSVKPFPDIKTALLTFAGVLLLLPAITLAGILNKEIPSPPFMEPFEEEAERIMALFLSDTGILAVLLNLFVIAVMAAITEEFFFRGVLQRIAGRWIKNHHIVIWSVALIFSIVHMQLSGLIPRLLLGAWLGYLLYWSRNIWVPVLAHFCNNALSVIGMTSSDLKENVYVSGEIPESEMPGFVIVAIITFILFCYAMYRLRERFRERLQERLDV
ncbi:MAG: CPBP family intramembrane metalloprotease [Tannerellaceae bacterium]|jgi:membrane protease YdiL (CAAX protease family)|nr:CPBP family intramembrane metalloprotease [Tannerellaceae bacterium]